MIKKWTVMLIPHAPGQTRTLTVSNLHFWVPAVFLVALSFVSAFYYQRQQELSQRAELLRQANRSLELQKASAPAEAPSAGPSRDEIRQVETRLRAEYEASIGTITAALNDLYEMEAKARSITGIAPRAPQPASALPAPGGGKGGVAGGAGFAAMPAAPRGPQVPCLIYGVSRPTADLLLQEISLRTRSLGDLVSDMNAQLERVSRMPAGWPLSRGVGRITSTFGYRIDPFSRRVSRHNAIDISARPGTSILATASGKVTEARYDGDYGNKVVIDHGGGMATLYAHLSKMDVKPGQTVKRGEVIGRVGSTGRSTGAHLHYEVHVKGTPVNPARYLSK